MSNKWLRLIGWILFAAFWLSVIILPYLASIGDTWPIPR